MEKCKICKTNVLTKPRLNAKHKHFRNNCSWIRKWFDDSDVFQGSQSLCVIRTDSLICWSLNNNSIHLGNPCILWTNEFVRGNPTQNEPKKQATQITSSPVATYVETLLPNWTKALREHNVNFHCSSHIATMQLRTASKTVLPLEITKWSVSIKELPVKWID